MLGISNDGNKMVDKMIDKGVVGFKFQQLFFIKAFDNYLKICIIYIRKRFKKTI